MIWSVALFLIAVLILPIAYAQAFTGTRIYFVLVNAVIIGLVLFILQAFLVPGKEGKEQVSAWVIVILASLVLAYFFGSTNYIWNGPLARFFSLYVLVNSIVISIVLYFLFGFLDIQKRLGGSPEGKTGMGLIIFLIALIFAVKIGNQWIWEQAVVAQLFGYLFGAQGILNPSGPAYRLWTFIGSATLLAFFFSGFLMKNVAGGNKINYALAIVIASNMASAGVSIQSVVIMAEVIFTIVLAEALKGTVGEKKGSNWLLAAFLVGWASAAATYGTEYQGMLARPVGFILWAFGFISVGPAGAVARPSGAGWFGWIFKTGGGALVLVLIILLFVFFFARAETRRRALTLAWTEFKRRLNATTKSTEFTEDIAEGREPSFFVRYRMLFHALASYTTRSEITYRYWAVVLDAAKMWDKLESTVKEFLDREQLRKDIISFRSGGALKSGHQVEGWNKLNIEVVDIVNRYLKLLARIQVSSDFGLKSPDAYQLETTEMTDLQTEAVELTERIKSARNQYNIRMEAYGAHYALKGYRDIMLNMTNVTGDVLEHPMKYARPGAKFIMEGQAGKPDTAGVDPEGYPTDEVNQFGEVIADINEQKDSFGNLPPDPRQYNKPRKVHPKDIIDYPSFVKFTDNISKDWRNLAFDIRYGLYHPFSRTHSAYIKAFGDRIYPEFQDKDIPFEKSPSTSDWAVDMRTLANPGLNKFWGRKSFHDNEPPLANPLPGLSSLGLKKFLFEAAKLAHTDQEEVKKYLNKYYADSAAPKKELPDSPIGVMLGEDVDLSKKE